MRGDQPVVSAASWMVRASTGPNLTTRLSRFVVSWAVPPVAQNDVAMMPRWCHTGAMDLAPHVEQIRGQLAVAADAGGEDARALAERLTAPLESAIRLPLLAALWAAADEIPRDLAPGSVELRLRAGEPDFVVTAPAPEG